MEELCSVDLDIFHLQIYNLVVISSVGLHFLHFPR